MKSAYRVLTAIRLVASAALTLVLISTTAYAGNPTNVNVVNTPNVNVANTPSVNVANTPSVSVTNTPSVSVSNTPSVNIANSPSVTVSGTASVTNAIDQNHNPIPLLVGPQGQPYADSCQSAIGFGSAQCLGAVLPQGKVLVVHFMTLESFVSSGGTVYDASTGYDLNGSFGSIYLPLSNGVTGDDGWFRQVAAVPITTFIGGAPGCSVSATSSAPVFVRCAFIGYLIPAQ